MKGVFKQIISKAAGFNKKLSREGETLFFGDAKVYVSTVFRGARTKELTGFIYKIDWKSQKIERKIPVPIESASPFWGERGGNRGGRGLFIHKNTLYAAVAGSILLYDLNLNKIGELYHKYLAGLHEIFVDDEGVWATCTLHDLIVKIDFEGNVLFEWWGSESKILQDTFSFNSRKLNIDLEFDKDNFSREIEKYSKEDRLHLNGVVSNNGNVYALAGNRASIIKISPQPDEVVVKDDELKAVHNCVIYNGQVIINDTTNQCVRIYDFDTGTLIKKINTQIFDSKSSVQFAKAGWQRGLAKLKDNIFLVGTSPATIFEVDVQREKIGKALVLDNDVHHCVHGLTTQLV